MHWNRFIIMVGIILHAAILNSIDLSFSGEKKLLLVVGCGRSGTTFTSKYLSSLGLDIQHEKQGNDGCVSWPMVVNSYSPWGPIAIDLNFRHIFHQVRNPLHVITSWYINIKDLDRDEWSFIRKHVKEIYRDDSLLVSCAKYWYYWNLKAEEMAEWRFRIEDLEHELPTLEKMLSIKCDIATLQQMPTAVNTWQPTKKKIKWSDLERELPYDLLQKIQTMAQRYGYAIKD